MKVLREYQEEALKILSRDTSGLIGSGLGTGKTLMAVERIRHLNPLSRTLVVSPVNAQPQWESTVAEQFPSLNGSPYLRIVGTPQSDPESWNDYLLKKQPGVYIIGWEALRGAVGEDLRRASNARRINKLTVKAVKQGIQEGKIPPWTRTGTWDLVIADECHRLQRRDSAQRLVLKQLKSTHKLALSFTPSGNKPEGLWSTLNWLWPQKYNAFWRWAETWLLVEEEQFNRQGDTKKTIVGEKDPGATWVDIPCKVRHRTEDVIDELPEVIERIVSVPMDPAQRRIYDEFERQAFAWLDEQPVAAPLPLTQRIRLRQAALGTLTAQVRRDGAGVDVDFNPRAPQPKIKAITEIISDLPDDEPVLIWTHSGKFAHMAAELLNRSVPGEARAWTGDLSAQQRAQLKHAFGKSVRIIIAQTASMAEALDGLQLVCRCEIIASPSEDQLMNQQAAGRLHRPGQTSPVQRWVLRSENSIDVDVAYGLDRRRNQMQRLYRDKVS